MHADLIASAVVQFELQHSDKPAILEELVDAVVTSGRVDSAHRDDMLAKLTAREQLGSTGIGNGVAVPHVKLDGFEDLVLAFGRRPDAVDWDAIDGAPVQLVFFLVGSPDHAERHLEALRWISGLARNADFRRFAVAADSEAALRDLMVEMGSA